MSQADFNMINDWGLIISLLLLINIVVVCLK